MAHKFTKVSSGISFFQKISWQASLFNSIILACDIICKQNMGYYEEVPAIGYDLEIHTENIIAWANYWAELSRVKDIITDG